MKVRLVVEQGARRRVMDLRPPEAIVGRAHGNTVRIPSADVSRRHCRLLLQDGLVSVEDLDSVNGTYLNGRKIQAIEYVRPGDHLAVGPVTFVVEYVLTAEALAILNGDDSAGEMLELIADDVVDSGEELLVMEPLEDEDLPTLEPMPEEDDLPLVMAAEEDLPTFQVDEEELLGAEFDDAVWQLPVDDDEPTHFE